MLVPFIQVLTDKVGENAAREVVDDTIRELAAEGGAKRARGYGQTTTSLRKAAEELWAGGGSLDVQIVAQSEDHLDFNVTLVYTLNSTRSRASQSSALVFTVPGTMPW